MFDTPIDKMDFKRLRNAVQTLNDELAVMKRKYEDIIYNLDMSNFSKSFTVEHNNMKTRISVTAEAIKTMVSNTDLNNALEKYSTIEQTAEAIKTKVSASDLEETLKQYSTFEQTAEKITSTVTGEYVKTLIGDTYVTNAVLSSKITQSADSILSTVSAKYETIAGAEEKYSAIEQKADSISTRVANVEHFKESVFTQTADGFTLDGEKTTFTGVIYLTDNNGIKQFALNHDESQGFPFVSIHGCSGEVFPIVIGDYKNGNHNVYIGGIAADNRVATRGWVKNNSIAVFG